ncbi:MAG TPA: 30S ribosomal protein S16 [Candidatus Hydrothermia bacterium]|nr:30S ribosomal protein S16 [Candidatus Hydrothermae bacterium]MDD3648900.1 30S ribosomal protein S16 [Candidatus Hydrothermia bacterium]MDD5572616.1 30S ribosomal protein S16 [Candidatus Hydrothermia bacterium]HOK23141.1 30S ribosomal protein S16 [Candidatus Hydrothermia bacterium]HOL23845.1 30S ribosomal protein S16 [Candidatus Hydrothermia bacterium]
MVVKVRLQRVGKTGRSLYRIVVQESRVHRDGKVIDVIGNYDPVKDVTKINCELLEKWISQGAQMTPRVAKLYKFYKKTGEKGAQ